MINSKIITKKRSVFMTILYLQHNVHYVVNGKREK